MNLKYEEVEQLHSLALLANKVDLASKLAQMQQDFWFPGTTMPPLYSTFIVQEYGSTQELLVRRKELLPSYSEYSSVQLHSGDETLELRATSFRWRRL